MAKKPEGLDLAGLLDVIEAEMKDAPDRLQWAMNHCLAQIGIEHPELRTRAIDIGERLQVLKDYPTPRAARRRSRRTGSRRWCADRTPRSTWPGATEALLGTTRHRMAPGGVTWRHLAPQGLAMAPKWCHYLLMDLTPYVDHLRSELAVAANAAW